MKKILPFLAFIIFPFLIILLLLLNIFIPKRKYKNYQSINYSLKGKNYQLLVANTPEKWEKGLMNFNELEGVAGMIFVFPDKKPRTFWNKNTYLDLKLYWLADDKIIGEDFLPSIKKSKKIISVSSPKPVDKVIELVIEKSLENSKPN